MALPIFKDINKNLMILQTVWASQINPILGNAIVRGLQLDQVALIMGATVINHLLSRKQQGWFVTDIDAASQIYRSAPFNDKTLTLNASSACVVNLWVY